MKRIATILITATIAGTFFSCKENDLEKQREQELKRLDEFIQKNYPNENPTASGLYYIELEKGTGDSIAIDDKVQIFYDIMTIDSTYVTSSGEYEPLELIVRAPTQLSSSATYVDELLGLHEALTYMKKGTKALLIMPSELAFGQYGSYNVGGFKTLLMEVEVYKFFPLEISD
jgi:FKBP-type peptidyl-prolyl cis-trans isomerase FkpA